MNSLKLIRVYRKWFVLMTIPQIKVPGSQGYNSHRGIVSLTQRPAENA